MLGGHLWSFNTVNEKSQTIRVYEWIYSKTMEVEVYSANYIK